MTQEELADIIGMSLTSYRDLEKDIAGLSRSRSAQNPISSAISPTGKTMLLVLRSSAFISLIFMATTK